MKQLGLNSEKAKNMHLSKVISESGHSPCHSSEVLATREPVNVATALGAIWSAIGCLTHAASLGFHQGQRTMVAPKLPNVLTQPLLAYSQGRECTPSRTASSITRWFCPLPSRAKTYDSPSGHDSLPGSLLLYDSLGYITMVPGKAAQPPLAASPRTYMERWPQS